MKIATDILIYSLLASPIVWIISLISLSRWKHFWKFFGLNILLIAIYITILVNPELSKFGHDEYGLNRFFHIILALFIHIILGGIFAVYKRRKLKESP
ncbi:MAG: hypothetical protein RIA69_16960 [Cyclobacteriaceae bacterium]